MAFDLRHVNENTVPVTWLLPHVESELADLAESKCFASIDVCQA